MRPGRRTWLSMSRTQRFLWFLISRRTLYNYEILESTFFDADTLHNVRAGSVKPWLTDDSL